MSEEGRIPDAPDDRSTSLGEVINLAVELATRGLMTCIPAKVVKYDASTNKANCQILIKNVTTAEDGSREVNSWPVVPGVIVQFVGAGGYRITCPISDGSDGSANTIGSLFFSHRSLDKWSTGSGGEVDPELDHDHALADAIFMPGLLPFGAPWQDVPSDGMSVGADGGLQMKITSSLMTLAATAANAQFVALADKVNTNFNTIFGLFTTLAGTTIAATAPPAADAFYTALAAAIAALGSSWPNSDVSATKVKAE